MAASTQLTPSSQLNCNAEGVNSGMLLNVQLRRFLGGSVAGWFEQFQVDAKCAESD